MNCIDTTSLVAQDITTPLLAATYTSDAARELLIAVGLSGVAGGGAYRACMTYQRGGVGAAYQSGTSAIVVSAGVTTVYLLTTPVAVQTDDVLAVWVQGLAADSSVDVVVDVFDVAIDIADLPTVTEFEARTLPSADYTVVSDLPSVPTVGEIDTQLSTTHGAGPWEAAAIGVFQKTYTVTANGVPIQGVFCRLTTDTAGLVMIDSGLTNSLGQVVFHHNLAGGTTVYVWPSKYGVLFDFGGNLYDKETI